MKRAYSLLMLGFLSACAVSDEGSVDYRYAEPSAGYTLTQRAPTSVISKEFQKGDVVSIHLKTAFVKSFVELGSLLDLPDFGNNTGRSQRRSATGLFISFKVWK